MNAYPKRLIEVDLPIKRISEHARREKSIRHGHISTLHIWWARRPLAACRAVLCAALWPDPADELCPNGFRKEAARLMKEFRDRRGGKTKDLNNPIEIRGALLDFIAEFADWDNANNKDFLSISRNLTSLAHENLGGAQGTKPLIVDPFSGGGSIPVEGLRLGGNVFATELNPVAVLLNKAVLEFIPRCGIQIVDDIRRQGAFIKNEAKKNLKKFYDYLGAEEPLTYLWARTVICEGPGCGAEIPLIRSLWLAKRKRNSVALRIIPKSRKGVDFEIINNAKVSDVKEGTVKRGSAICPCCGYTTAASSVRSQLKKRFGGANDARMFCVVTGIPGAQGKNYRVPNQKDIQSVVSAAKELEKKSKEYKSNISMIPDEVLPVMSGVFNAPLYGHNTWGSLFTARQLLNLTFLVNTIKQMKISDEVKTFLAFALDRQADYLSSLVVWSQGGEFVAHTFGRQALPMITDFAETVPWADTSGNWDGAIDWICRYIENMAQAKLPVGTVQKSSATKHPLPDDAADIFFTDPPYYNAVPYADLSDFFYVWLKRTIGDIFPDLFNSHLVPKEEEICEMAGWDPVRYPEKDGKWFELEMQKAMSEGRRVLSPWGIGVIVFAHKSTSGWEALLQAMLNAGWVCTASWSIDTERPGRLRAHGSAALASSIHLVVRPRENLDGTVRMDDIGDWRDVLAELPKRIHDWMPRLAKEGVVGADAIFACLGPALEIFSRYSRVEKASGEQVALKEYLEQVWAVVAKEALNMIFEGADTAGFEEDARLTAMWLWTLSTGTANGDVSSEEEGDEEDEEKSTKTKLSGYTLEYDAARKIAQGLGAHLEQLQNLVEVKGDKARLLPVSERTKTLFGKDESEAPLTRRKKKSSQMDLGFMEEVEKAEQEGSWGQKNVPQLGKTRLDRLHQAMILFAAGRGEALKRFLVEEGVGRDEKFWRLAQALSALYPPNTDERRWVEGVQARKKGFGF